MALHIMPVNELHQRNPKCPCRPRREPHRRRMAWKHNAAPVAPVVVTCVVEPPPPRFQAEMRHHLELLAVTARTGRAR